MQIGYSMLIILILIAFLIIFAPELPLGMRILDLILFLVVFSCFGTLTVQVSNRYVRLRFGIGPIKIRFKLQDLQSCKTVRNSFFHGFGIRVLANGLLYNVSGLDAVEIKLKNGRVYRIGTDEPEKLNEIIGKQINR